jgi:hypothetical protein
MVLYGDFFSFLVFVNAAVLASVLAGTREDLSDLQ